MTRTNVKAFLIFVFSHAILCIYGGVVFALVIFGELSKVNDTKWEQFTDIQTGFSASYQYVWDFYGVIYTFAKDNWLIMGLGTTNFTLGLTLPFFFGYHISLLLKNRTTNEEIKLKKLKFGLNNQTIFYRALIGKTKKLVAAFE